MRLGAFSISLAVSDIQKSKQFYEHLGFNKFHGDIEQGWLLMKQGEHIIGLFQDMFDKNILTFNPGWDQDGQNLEQYDDVRAIKAHVIDCGIPILSERIPEESGAAHIVIEDPDGNRILIDQHR